MKHFLLVIIVARREPRQQFEQKSSNLIEIDHTSMLSCDEHLWANILWTTTERLVDVILINPLLTKSKVCQLDMPFKIYKNIFWL